jgi:uncharacterized protein (TIGR02444 family)
MSRALLTAESVEAEALWAFCLSLYARSEVEAACLNVQDRHGCDVMIVLFCIYAGHLGQRVDSITMDLAIEIGRGWGQDIVGPMRQVRRKLKTPPASVDPHDAYRLRTRLQALEQDAERIQHEQLFALLSGKAAPSLNAARSNLIAYAERLGIARPQAFDVILDAAFPKG